MIGLIFCVACKKELISSEAILLSPSDEQGKVKKYHICKGCYKNIINKILRNRDKGE